MQEVRLIDANALMKRVCEKECGPHFDINLCDLDDDSTDTRCVFRDYVRAAPTIEAEPVRKPEMSEADRKKCEEWCKDCEHIEMCKWYPFVGCDFRLLPKPEQSTIEPEVRHGRWIFVGEETTHDGWTHRKYKCSECGFSTVEAINFCPNCGRDMRATDTNVGGKGVDDNAE